MGRALDRLHELGRETCAALEDGDLERCAVLMNDQWEAKRDRAPGTVIAEMDALRERALEAGGLGAVPLGAGGGGFVLVYTPDPERTRRGPWPTPPSCASEPTRRAARPEACGPRTGRRRDLGRSAARASAGQHRPCHS